MRYFVVGDGGSLYGPADGSQLQNWVNEGRILPTTKLKEEVSGRHVFASEVPGLRFPASQNPLGGYETIADFPSSGAPGPAPYVPPSNPMSGPSVQGPHVGNVPYGSGGGSAPYGSGPSNPGNTPYGNNPYGSSPGGYQPFGGTGQNPNEIDTTTPLIKSIIGLSVCACCGSICSIVGLVYSLQASSAKSTGNYEMVRQTAAQANAWANWGLIINIVIILAYFGLVVLGIAFMPS